MKWFPVSSLAKRLTRLNLIAKEQFSQQILNEVKKNRKETTSQSLLIDLFDTSQICPAVSQLQYFFFPILKKLPVSLNLQLHKFSISFERFGKLIYGWRWQGVLLLALRSTITTSAAFLVAHTLQSENPPDPSRGIEGGAQTAKELQTAGEMIAQ